MLCSIIFCNDIKSNFVQKEINLLIWFREKESLLDRTCGENTEWTVWVSERVSVSQAYICVCVLSNGKEGNGIKCSDHWSWKLPIHWFDKQHERPLWYIARSSLCVWCLCVRLWSRDKAGVSIWLCASGMKLKKMRIPLWRSVCMCWTSAKV